MKNRYPNGEIVKSKEAEDIYEKWYPKYQFFLEYIALNKMDQPGNLDELYSKSKKHLKKNKVKVEKKRLLRWCILHSERQAHLYYGDSTLPNF